MEHYKALYKVNSSVLTAKNKRKAANEIRAAKRSELHSSTRNISLSPRPGIPSGEQKENFKPPLDVAPPKPEKIVSNGQSCVNSVQQHSKINEKQTRQMAHLMKFLAWKAEKAKQAQLNDQKSKRAPFVVPTGGAVTNEPRNFKKTFAPKNHVFCPPANLEQLTLEVVGSNSIRCMNGAQQATYHFVETPKKKRNESKVASVVKSSHVREVHTLKPLPPKPIVHKTPVSVPIAVQKPSVTTEPKSRFPSSITKKTPSTVFKHPEPAPLPPSIEKSSAKPDTKSSKMQIRPKIPPAPQKIQKPQNSMPLRSKMPPPSQQVQRITRKTQTSTAATASASTKQAKAKAGLPALKRPTFKASKKDSTSISNALLTISGKARSKTTGVPPKLKLNENVLLKSIVENNKLADPNPETPADVNPVNSYINFVTSTKRKSSSLKDSNADLLFADLGNTISPVDDCCPTPGAQKSEVRSNKKFNFVRYSIVQSDKDKAVKPEETDKAQPSDGPDEEANVTPEKTGEPPTNYMSPYVSVSRGKVSTKVEREKRSSIYMAAVNSAAATADTTAAVRHTLATVRYYRKQLMDEIARLNDQCAVWAKYKEDNAQLIEGGGVDMIDVTIGQTKLLTNKKLKQFGGLIDRCEDGVLGKSSTSNGGGEGAKPILPEDLEGFWSMVGLQIENVDKRFTDLERWKANNWTDPDEVVTKPAKSAANAKKTKKSKPVSTARPNSDLQKMLRTAHAAYLNKKAVGGADEDIILTPSKSRHVLIRDRRSRSAAATIITVNTPRMSRKSPALEGTPTSVLNETPKLIPHINNFHRGMNILMSTHLSKQETKSPATDSVSPLRNQAVSRKSILKTPGSRRLPKSVIFNSPALKFTIEDTVDDAKPASNEDQEEDQRIYKLRNRRIILRDSAEFVIPK